VTTPKLPPPPPVWAHQCSRFGSDGSQVATTLGPSVLVHRDHLDRIQLIRGEAELAAEKIEGGSGHMAAHADRRILAQRDHDSPDLEQRLERLAMATPGTTSVRLSTQLKLASGQGVPNLSSAGEVASKYRIESGRVEARR